MKGYFKLFLVEYQSLPLVLQGEQCKAAWQSKPRRPIIASTRGCSTKQFEIICHFKRNLTGLLSLSASTDWSSSLQWKCGCNWGAGRFTSIHLFTYLKISGFQRFIKTPPSYFTAVIQTSRDWRLFWTHQQYLFLWLVAPPPPPGFPKCPNLDRQDWFIDPELPAFHFMFSGISWSHTTKMPFMFSGRYWSHIQDFQAFLNGSSSLSAARLFEN